MSRKALLTIAALSAFACTPQYKDLKPKEEKPVATVALENKIMPPRGVIEKHICNEETPCSEIQKDFLYEIEQILALNQYPMKFYNTDIGILWTDSHPYYYLVEKDGNLKECIAVSEEDVACQKSEKTVETVLQGLKEHLKNRLNKNNI